jgi:hypothetical protein
MGNLMSFIKKLFGIDKKEAELKEYEATLNEKGSKSNPKAVATRKKEPWVGVLDTHVNSENVRNGFFELDWNEYFIVQLINEGYGTKDDPEEEIVDRWFRELCANVVVDGDYGGPVETGSLDINAVKRDN